MRFKLAPWVALVAATVVFGVAFWVLGQGLLALAVAVPAFAGTFFGVYWMVDSRSKAQVAAIEFTEATEREVDKVRQTVGGIQQLIGRIADDGVKHVLLTACHDVLALLEMVRSRQPHELFFSANSLAASTASLQESVRGYLAIQDNARLGPEDRRIPLGQGATAFRAFADEVRTRLRLVDVGDIAAYTAQLKRWVDANPDLPTP
jgi:hypothetical protein